MTNNYTTSCTCGCQRPKDCLYAVISIIGALLAFTIGVIIALTNFEALTGALTAIIAIAIILAVMLVVFVIIKLCNRCNNTNKGCC